MRYAALILFSLLAFSSAGSAQNVGAKLLYTVGTTEADGARTRAYLLWQATAPDLFQSRDYAVYAKPGEPDSGGSFSRLGRVSLTTDPVAIRAMLNQGEALGDDLNELDERLNEMFQELLPPDPEITTAEKLSIIIGSAVVDPELFENVRLLARLYASVNLCLGHAYTTPFPSEGTTTFEIREFDTEAGEDIRVVGRVTLDAGAHDPLPAPGIPHDVPQPIAPDSIFTASPKGHLNVRLRWATPNDLRRLSLLQYGYNVYRVPKAKAEAEINIADPNSTTFLNQVGSDPDYVQVNRLPVITEAQLSASEASNAADEETYFFADDNDRFEPDGEAFNDGDQFYYFVAARDVLGRPGEVSPGQLVTICDRMPPAAPLNLDVENVYEYNAGNGEQFLRVSWDQPTPDNPHREAHQYYVYRWSSVDEMQQESGDPAANLIAGPIPADPSGERMHFDDLPSAMNGNPPTMPNDAGTTYWYTVRSEDDSACGGNLSGNSEPAYGVLRDRVGPDRPGGEVEISCMEPLVAHLSTEQFDYKDDISRETGGFIRFIAQRTSKAITWAEFYFELELDTVYRYSIGRVRFDKGSSTASVEYGDIPAGAQVYCRVGTSFGKTSDPASAIIPSELQKGMDSIKMTFEAEVMKSRVTAGGDCLDHVAVDPDPIPGQADILPVDVTLFLTPTTREWKVYRRIDGGELTLVGQGEADYQNVSEIEFSDTSMPSTPGATVCYFGQVFDEHGNPSPMERIECISINGQELPKPMLAGITPMPLDQPGDTPQAEIRWFCPTPGVERFEIFIAPTPDEMPNRVSENLSPDLGEGAEKLSESVAPADLNFRVFQTPSLEAGFGNGSAEFSVLVDVEYGKEYRVVVRAVGQGSRVERASSATEAGSPSVSGTGGYGNRPAGPFSNVRPFVWRPAEAVAGPTVPWPARGLPAIDTASDAVDGDFEAIQWTHNGRTGVGVRIGDYRLADPLNPEEVFPIESNSELLIPQDSFYIDPSDLPEDVIYQLSDLQPTQEGADRDVQAQSLLPFVLYRYQVPTNDVSDVSGTITQVTPKLDQIAYQADSQLIRGKGDDTYEIALTRVADPFIFAQLTGDSLSTSNPTHEILTVDHHPVVTGAAYRYLLVRYDEEGEIDRILPTNTITITTP